jgi:hypothetical protein
VTARREVEDASFDLLFPELLSPIGPITKS